MPASATSNLGGEAQLAPVCDALSVQAVFDDAQARLVRLSEALADGDIAFAFELALDLERELATWGHCRVLGSDR